MYRTTIISFSTQCMNHQKVTLHKKKQNDENPDEREIKRSTSISTKMVESLRQRVSTDNRFGGEKSDGEAPPKRKVITVQCKQHIKEEES